jgi:hypothetical protein
MYGGESLVKCKELMEVRGEEGGGQGGEEGGPARGEGVEESRVTWAASEGGGHFRCLSALSTLKSPLSTQKHLACTSTKQSRSTQNSG